MLPDIKITAQQPGIHPKAGLADTTGNQNAWPAAPISSSVTFCRMAQAKAFRPIDQRHVSGLAHCEEIAQLTGLTLDLGGV